MTSNSSTYPRVPFKALAYLRDSDDDGQEQSTRLPSELLGKQNWRLPTNKKTLHGTTRQLPITTKIPQACKLNCSSDKGVKRMQWFMARTLPSELLVRQRRQTHVTGHGTRRRVTTDTLDASYRQQLSKTLFRPCISSSRRRWQSDGKQIR